MGSDGLAAFEVDEDEVLQVGAVDREGNPRTIYVGAEPGEFTIVPNEELVEGQDGVNLDDIEMGELQFDDLRVLGQSRLVLPGENVEVNLTVGENEVARGGYEGLYALLWIPIATQNNRKEEDNPN